MRNVASTTLSPGRTQSGPKASVFMFSMNSNKLTFDQCFRRGDRILGSMRTWSKPSQHSAISRTEH